MFEIYREFENVVMLKKTERFKDEDLKLVIKAAGGRLQMSPPSSIERDGGEVVVVSTEQEKSKAGTCMQWFNAMATESEKTLMKPPDDPAAPHPDDGERRRLAARQPLRAPRSQPERRAAPAPAAPCPSSCPPPLH